MQTQTQGHLPVQTSALHAFAHKRNAMSHQCNWGLTGHDVINVRHEMMASQFRCWLCQPESTTKLFKGITRNLGLSYSRMTLALYQASKDCWSCYPKVDEEQIH